MVPIIILMSLVILALIGVIAYLVLDKSDKVGTEFIGKYDPIKKFVDHIRREDVVPRTLTGAIAVPYKKHTNLPAIPEGLFNIPIGYHWTLVATMYGKKLSTRWAVVKDENF